MNKNEILEKSRRANIDESEIFAMNKGRKLGILVMMAMSIILIVFNLVKGENNSAIFALFWTYLGFEGYGRYKFTKNKIELIGAILEIITGIVFFAEYIIVITVG